MQEFREDLEKTRQSVATIAQWIRKSNGKVVIQTGAGVSTASDIPDFRGPNGVWTRREQGELPDMKIQYLEDAAPSYPHQAITQLVQSGLASFLITSNLDGLHWRSGVPIEQLTEIHGSIYKEICEVCGMTYHRPFDVVGSAKQRYTGRLCDDENCRGKLRDTIINFGEFLQQSQYQRSDDAAADAELMIIIGTSMTVSSSADFLKTFLRRKNAVDGRFVLVNLQQTSFDKRADLRIYQEAEVFFRMLMEDLGIEVPEFTGPYSLSDEELQNIRDQYSWDPEFASLSKYGTERFDEPPPKSLLNEILLVTSNRD